MSLKELRAGLELERFEETILSASEDLMGPSPLTLSRMRVPRSAFVIVVGLLVLSATVAGAVLLSKPYVYRGYLEVQHLLFTAFNHTPNDGGPALVNFMSDVPSSFNFSVLNRWRGSIPYNLSFALEVSYAAIVSVSGVLVQYDVNHTTGLLVDGATFPIAWTIVPDNKANGLSPTFVAVEMPNDAGEQFFRADITLSFVLNAQFTDGTHSMTVSCVTP